MGNFQKGGNRGGFRGGDRGGERGGRGDFKKKTWGNDRGGDRDRGPVTMHRATCGDCGRTCEVPFRPMGDKPVFCNECFGGKRDSDRSGDRDRTPRREFNDRSASTSFSKPTQGTDDMKRQLSEINTKIERLINLFEKSLKTKGETSISKSEPIIVVKEEPKKTSSLKSILKKVVEVKAPVAKKSPSKKVVTKKKI
jgi:CxxC-x17-CxxC domain-containing protein